MLALLGVVVLGQELPVAAFDDRSGVGLDLIHHTQDFGDLGIQRGPDAVEDVAVGVGRLVAVLHPLDVGADLLIPSNSRVL